MRAAGIYRELMDEIKTRLGVIHTTIDRLKAKPDQPLGFIGAETAILQLRNVCELMAHAAIAANQPFGMVEELLDSWDARLAYNDLKGLNPQCFPFPVGKASPGETGPILVEFKQGPPTLRGLLKCYMRCGKLLHRGILRHALDGTAKIYDLDWIDEWATRIGELLVHHTTMVLNEGWVFITKFYDENAQVEVLIASSHGGAIWLEPKKPARKGRRERS
jgi:hypothetical protein